MVTLDSLDTVKHNLERAKAQLKDVDENIRRITGRDPGDDWFRRSNEAANRYKNDNRGIEESNSTDVDNINEKQKMVDDDIHVSIASSVVQVAESRKRADASKELKKSDRERGRRMLGILQGTLNQFRAESMAATLQPQMTKRRQIDAKLEAKADQERQRMKRERGELFRTRRIQQIEVNMLHRKMKLIKDFDHWKENILKMKAFCRTSRGEPAIYYRPLVHSKESKRRLMESARVVDAMIADRQGKLETYFEEMDKQRRQFASKYHEMSDQHHSMDEDEEGDEPGGKMTQNGVKPALKAVDEVVLLPSSVGNLYRQVQNESSSWAVTSTMKKRSRTRRDSSSSGASETLAMAGDEEPVLMDEEHVPPTVNPVPSEFSAPSVEPPVDTRTVRVNQSKLVPSAV